MYIAIKHMTFTTGTYFDGKLSKNGIELIKVPTKFPMPNTIIALTTCILSQLSSSRPLFRNFNLKFNRKYAGRKPEANRKWNSFLGDSWKYGRGECQYATKAKAAKVEKKILPVDLSNGFKHLSFRIWCWPESWWRQRYLNPGACQQQRGGYRFV